MPPLDLHYDWFSLYNEGLMVFLFPYLTFCHTDLLLLFLTTYALSSPRSPQLRFHGSPFLRLGPDSVSYTKAGFGFTGFTHLFIFTSHVTTLRYIQAVTMHGSGLRPRSHYFWQPIRCSRRRKEPGGRALDDNYMRVGLIVWPHARWMTCTCASAASGSLPRLLRRLKREEMIRCPRSPTLLICI